MSMTRHPPTEDTAAAAASTATRQFTSWLSHVAQRPRQERHLPRAHRGRRALRRSLTDGILLRPQNISNLIVQNGYILDPRDRHGDGHHRRPHRPVGRIGRRLRRRRAPGVFAVHMGLPWWLAIILSLADRRARRRLAGLLDRLRRHPGVHRDAGRHAHLPRPRARRARQRQHRLVPGRVPRARQRLPHRRVR